MSAFSLLLLPVLWAEVPEYAAPTTEQIREAIARSIPAIESKGAAWIEEKNCVSCHRVGTMIWSLRAAQGRGFDVSDKLEEWTRWSVDSLFDPDDSGRIAGTNNREGIAQLLLSGGIKHREDQASESYDKLIGFLVGGQEGDGTWKAGGQLPQQKREGSETNDVSTMWLTLTLQQVDARNDHQAVIEKALHRIEQSPRGQSTEWYAVRLLLAQQQSEDLMRQQMIDELSAQQQPDGGWGWIVGEPSDALGTGLSLYALIRAGVDRDNPVIERAQRFLIDAQQADGSWLVHGTKAIKKDQVEETASYWGTTWATLGLVTSLPE